MGDLRAAMQVLRERLYNNRANMRQDLKVSGARHPGLLEPHVWENEEAWRLYETVEDLLASGLPSTPPTVKWEEVTSTGYASGNRLCLGRGRVPGGWIYEFSRWHSDRGQMPFAVFVPDEDKL